MKNLLDGLFKLLLVIGCAVLAYNYHFKGPQETRRVEARYAENPQESVFSEEDAAENLDDCHRHIDNDIRQSCLDARK